MSFSCSRRGEVNPEEGKRSGRSCLRMQPQSSPGPASVKVQISSPGRHMQCWLVVPIDSQYHRAQDSSPIQSTELDLDHCTTVHYGTPQWVGRRSALFLPPCAGAIPSCGAETLTCGSLGTPHASRVATAEGWRWRVLASDARALAEGVSCLPASHVGRPVRRAAEAARRAPDSPSGFGAAVRRH
jgi:hypothetical protein